MHTFLISLKIRLNHRLKLFDLLSIEVVSVMRRELMFIHTIKLSTLRHFN